jgi:hypothetical protein
MSDMIRRAQGDVIGAFGLDSNECFYETIASLIRVPFSRKIPSDSSAAFGIIAAKRIARKSAAPPKSNPSACPSAAGKFGLLNREALDQRTYVAKILRLATGLALAAGPSLGRE